MAPNKRIEFRTAARCVYGKLIGMPNIDWSQIVQVHRSQMKAAEDLIFAALISGELTLWAETFFPPKDGGAKVWAVPKLENSHQYRQGMRMMRLTYQADESAELARKPLRVAELNAADLKFFVLSEFEEWVASKTELSHQHMISESALNNMSQGLCMFDADRRLITCNRRFVELYSLSEELARPGTPLNDILAYRVETGSYSRSPTSRHHIRR